MFCYFDKASKVAYYPIHKNGSTTFGNLVKKLNWATTENMELLSSEYKIFAHVRDPIERHFAGTVEYILAHKLEHTIEDPILKKLWTSALMDIHSYPITWVLGDVAKRIHWIPFAKGFNSTQATLNFLNKHSVTVTNIDVLHESNSDAMFLRKKLMDLHDIDDKFHSLTYFYEHDYKLFYKALDEYIFKKSKWENLDE
jgi:hypothetical protein